MIWLAVFVLFGQAIVTDADTIKVQGERVRLIGIDAPESRQVCKLDGKPWLCGKDAANALHDKIRRKHVRCEWEKRDRYKRPLAVCTMDGESINMWLVESGWAYAYRFRRCRVCEYEIHKSDLKYLAAEKRAQAAARGLWRGEVIRPWEWRRGKR